MRLLGRDGELDDVDRRLRAGRLVTLIGPGGVGKTALAVEAAGRAADRFALGVRIVDLTRVDDAGAVPGALASQLGFDSFQAAEYVSGEPARAIALAESTSVSLAAPSLAAVTLRRVLGQAHRALGDVPRALAAFRDGADMARQLEMPAMAIELDVAHAQTSADDGRVDEALLALRASVDESVRIGSVISEAWARSCLGWVTLRVDAISALEEIERALEISQRIDYPIGVAVNLRSRAFAEVLRDDVAAARATVAELLDDVVGRGAISHARFVVDVAAVLAHRIGDASWAQLASTAATRRRRPSWAPATT